MGHHNFRFLLQRRLILVAEFSIFRCRKKSANSGDQVASLPRPVISFRLSLSSLIDAEPINGLKPTNTFTRLVTGRNVSRPYRGTTSTSVDSRPIKKGRERRGRYRTGHPRN